MGLLIGNYIKRRNIKTRLSYLSNILVSRLSGNSFQISSDIDTNKPINVYLEFGESYNSSVEVGTFSEPGNITHIITL
jgi:hypothetical protein